MDIGALNQTVQSAAQGSAARPTDFPVVKKSDTSKEPVEIPKVDNVDIREADMRRMQAIKDALRKAVKESYAVSDRSFTIYKDTSGQFITRFTNLRDGSVTYVPEPEIMQRLSSTGSNTNFLQMNV
jgi:hypothetical protein